MTHIELNTLTPEGIEYLEVQEFFHRKGASSKNFELKIVAIHEVTNPKLFKRFQINQARYKNIHGHVQLLRLFHGTKRVNIPSILKDNLEVCRHGLNCGDRFGPGVSFSAIPYYSSHYCDKFEQVKQMLLCWVLVSNIIEIPENMPFDEPPFIPGHYPLQYDTTAKNKETMDVIVKFRDHTFYPAYVIDFQKVPRGHTAKPLTFDYMKSALFLSPEINLYPSFSITKLSISDPDYRDISRLFHRRGATNLSETLELKIVAIYEVTNHRLHKRFEINRSLYRNKYGSAMEHDLFHGTKRKNVVSILKNNLQVRSLETGLGVSFSRRPYISSLFCDEFETVKQMLLCNVLVSNIITVQRDCLFDPPPFIEGGYPLRYDTTAHKSTLVKFEDHTFYPEYVISFREVRRRHNHPIMPLEASHHFQRPQEQTFYESAPSVLETICALALIIFIIVFTILVIVQMRSPS